MKITAIDFETANQNPASVCAVGISVMEDGVVEPVYSTLIRPKENVGYFSPWNIAVHGIHPAQVQDAKSFPEVYTEMKPYLQDALIVAHNARFDMGCLKASCMNCGIEVPVLRYFDTVELSKRMFPMLEHHRLNDMCEYLDIELDHHRADSDAYGCLMIVARVMAMSGIYDIDELLDQCNTKVRTLK